MPEKYDLSPKMRGFVEECESYFAESIVTRGIAAQRNAYNAMTANFDTKRSASLLVTEKEINGVNTRQYQPKGGKTDTTILFAHGGGWYLGDLNCRDSFCADIALKCQVTVIAIDYRLAPEYPFPAGLNDCYNVYQALIEQGSAPLLMGDSAGANFMAALTLRCKAEKREPAVAQILIYPALAVPFSLPSHQAMSDAPLLSSDGVKFCFANYIPHCYHYEQVESLFPLQAPSLALLPPAAIFAAQYDPLIDDATHYCQRLQESGVQAHCTVIEGLVHGGLHGVGITDEADNLLQGICDAVLRFKHTLCQ